MHLCAMSHVHFDQKSTSRSSSIVYCKPTERMFYQPYKIRKLFFISYPGDERQLFTSILFWHSQLLIQKTLFMNCNSRSHFCANHETHLCFSLMKPPLTLQSLKSLNFLENSVFSSQKFVLRDTTFKQRVEALLANWPHLIYCESWRKNSKICFS